MNTYFYVVIAAESHQEFDFGHEGSEYVKYCLNKVHNV